MKYFILFLGLVLSIALGIVLGLSIYDSFFEVVNEYDPVSIQGM